MPPKTTLLSIALAATLLVAACTPDTVATTTEPAPGTTTTAPLSAGIAPPATAGRLPAGTAWTTAGPVSGNRVLDGSGTVGPSPAIDIPLSGEPRWIVGGANAEGPVWVVAFEDGRLEAWRLVDTGPVKVGLNIDQLPPGLPPVIISSDEGITVVKAPADASPTAQLLPLSGGGLAYVTSEGVVVVESDGVRVDFDLAALPDARPTESEGGLIAVLVGATNRYPHGVLGDELEAGRVAVIDPNLGEIVGEAIITEPAVIEGTSALWADIDDDGEQEILMTVSDGEVGAALAVFDRDGNLVAEGPPIGRGGRWRNQLGVGPTGPNGETEVIDVRVPHIGGVVEYFRISNDELVIQTQQQGYTSHVFGSRNLDMALGADLTGDGIIDIVVPNQELMSLGVLSRTAEGVAVAMELSLPGRLTTNLAGSIDNDGRLYLAVGTADRILRIWPAG